MALCIWREARGEQIDGKRGVGHVIQNRADKPCWWGNDVRSVILKPWQFSSFNANDPNSERWPDIDDSSWTDSLYVASAILLGGDMDVTDGATHYYDSSIGWPKAWGNRSEYINTVNIGRLHFWKLVPPNNHQAVQEAIAEP